MATTLFVCSATRKSLQEILDDIRRQDADSDVKIESAALESVVTALDARHLFEGKYHPNMQLKARMDRMDGVNAGTKERPLE